MPLPTIRKELTVQLPFPPAIRRVFPGDQPSIRRLFLDPPTKPHTVRTPVRRTFPFQAPTSALETSDCPTIARVPSNHYISPMPRIRKVGLNSPLVRKVKLDWFRPRPNCLPRITHYPAFPRLAEDQPPESPQITRYPALPALKPAEGQSPGPQFLSGVPGVTKFGVKWGIHEGDMKVRKVWGSVFDPFDEDLPFDPKAPVKFPASSEKRDTEGGSPVRAKGIIATMGGLPLEGHRIERPDVKTTYVDTHCHLVTTLKKLNDETDGETIPQNDLDLFVKSIFPPQVSAVVDIHCDLPLTDNHEKAAALNWPDHFKYYFSIGVHPRCAMFYTDEVHESLIKTMSHPSCVAWGECGIDYYRNPNSTYSIQRTVFARQLTAAVALGKPIVIHAREADNDILAAIQEHVPKSHRLHLHCFTSGPLLAKTVLKEYPNAYLGLTGVISYTGMGHVNELIRNGYLPAERILLETDSPYMVPKKAYKWLVEQRPLSRKKRFVISHAGMIPFTAETVRTEINKGRRERGEKMITLDELLDITRNNAAKMYGIDV